LAEDPQWGPRAGPPGRLRGEAIADGGVAPRPPTVNLPRAARPPSQLWLAVALHGRRVLRTWGAWAISLILHPLMGPLRPTSSLFLRDNIISSLASPFVCGVMVSVPFPGHAAGAPPRIPLWREQPVESVHPDRRDVRVGDFVPRGLSCVDGPLPELAPTPCWRAAKVGSPMRPPMVRV